MRTCTQKSRLFPVFFKNMFKSNSQNSQGTAWTTISRGDAEMLDTLISMLIFKTKMKFSRLERLYQTPKKVKASLSKSTSFQIHSSKCSFKTAFFQTSIFKFYLLSPISALLLPTCSTLSFQKLVEKIKII